ncbi:MAG: precorrin-6Y C5,15-methyltransferase (decarboxylating) subunit CbiT [Oscillospiraceae bacterium]|nr:precorrin-6Y C5,15-methyltransferase (decarboxylating) subunit CbiT [Oscillospiraceae bacterium]
MTVTIAATGMGGTATLTCEAQEAIAAAELLIGAGRMLEPYETSGKALFRSYDPASIAERLRSGSEQTAAVLMSGDTGFFSGTRKLLPLLTGMEVRVLPGIASPVYLCARTGRSWERLHCVTLHGTEGSIAVHVRSHPLTCFLLGGRISAAMLCRRLLDYSLPDTAVHIGMRLGCPDEQILHGNPADFTALPPEKLCTVLVENPACCPYLPSGIPDSAFLRTTVPMTKSEVRCLAVSSLCIAPDDIVWDIGCGTGSVTTELALRCPDGHVYAIDRSAGAVRLTLENLRRFSCDNVTVTEGTFPETPLPPPGKVFLGGTGGSLRQIAETVYAANPAAHIVLTAVTLETLAAAQTVFAALGKACTVTQIAVTRTKHVGSHTLLQAENPVFLISVQPAGETSGTSMQTTEL